MLSYAVRESRTPTCPALSAPKRLHLLRPSRNKCSHFHDVLFFLDCLPAWSSMILLYAYLRCGCFFFLPSSQLFSSPKSPCCPSPLFSPAFHSSLFRSYWHVFFLLHYLILSLLLILLRLDNMSVTAPFIYSRQINDRKLKTPGRVTDQISERRIGFALIDLT